VGSSFITTVTERCRMCYACVRECPVKAIRVTEGQARVIEERCIACGNCVRICSQHAKVLRGTAEDVRTLLASGQPVAACLAPSFPAQFDGLDARRLVGMVRALGFAQVTEVSFGADLVAREYARVLASDDDRRWLSTTCPAVVRYVERHVPEQVEALLPVVSPMIAMARVLRRRHGPDLRIVFVGPCAAKKVEAADPALAGEVDAALTFVELARMFAEDGLDAEAVTPTDFDPPHGRTGGLFPVSGGILQAAGLREDLMTGEVVATQGRHHMVGAIREFAEGALGARLLEALCCEGCISGPGIDSDRTLFQRRRLVREWVSERVRTTPAEAWEADMRAYADLDLRRTFRAEDQRIAGPTPDELDAIMRRMGKQSPGDELNCGACGYDTCVEHAVAIHKNLAESEMCLPHTIDQLRRALGEVEASHTRLAAAQEALVQSEKLASMGQLAAGIAHEVNNPLGVVLMYSHLMLDESDPASPARADLAVIAEQAGRCKRIVAGLLDFARQNKVRRAPCDVGALVDATLATLAPPAAVRVQVEHALADRTAELDRDQIVQVLINLAGNAVAAMPTGGTLVVRTEGDERTVRLVVRDTGTGISPDHLKRIFDPFFTTKPMGQGTGLGLAVTYGIVKMHMGDIRVESQADPAAGPIGTTVTVTLPRKE